MRLLYISESNLLFYAFIPFSLILKILQKLLLIRLRYKCGYSKSCPFKNILIIFARTPTIYILNFYFDTKYQDLHLEIISKQTVTLPIPVIERRVQTLTTIG